MDGRENVERMSDTCQFFTGKTGARQREGKGNGVRVVWVRVGGTEGVEGGSEGVKVF